MDHYLVRSIEKAFGWSGAGGLGVRFARGNVLDEGLCRRLLTPLRLLDVVMRRSLAPPQFRCFQHGEELHPDAYLARVVSRRGQAVSMADMDRVGRLLGSGCTLVLDALDTFDPTMEVACRGLQWWSREVVQVNTYLTTNDAAGFSLHWDDHDVVVVQLAGDKEWDVRGPSRIAPMYRDAERNATPSEVPVWSGTLRAGDVMHIPRGYWHQATRQGLGDGYSLHVTFGFVKRTGVDWLTWVADRSREREHFRTDIDRAATERQDTELTGEVSALLADYPIQTYLAAREQERPPPRQVASGGVFGPPGAVLCVAAFPPHVERDGTTVVVRAAGKKITFAERAAPALELLLSGHPVELAEVSAATGLDAAAVAAPLLKEGVCAELTEALSSACTGLVPTASYSTAR